MRILHIEDDPGLQKIIARGLKRHFNAAVTTVARPGDAITALQLDTFDVVVSDYNIDGGNGGEVLAWVRANRPDQRFIFLSSEEDIIARSGVPYVLKPAPISDLCRAIEDTIK